ncbi:hypothetical protein LguiA_024089 [Lonicera macranthoides]
MPLAKLRASSTPDAMKSEEGNDSLDTFIRQAIGKEPFFSFPRSGDSPVQWIQLLHALDQQDLPGWPLLTPLKVQLQKCEKCSREFCSPINYRRHIRVHRRSLNVDKESHKNRNLLGAFWDKLPLDKAKEIVSFRDVALEDVPGSSIIRTLTATIRKPGFCTLPQVYVRAGSALLDIIQARPSKIPISSQELFSILDDASERTFLCAGAAESVQKYVFDGEAGKIGLEMKNVVACTSFLVEQKLVKAWLADKDAEALRCQKLLVEEEEAAQKRQAELLERKRQRKLRQKEQKAREQSNGEKAAGIINVTADTEESTTSPSVETSSPSAPSEANSQAMDTSTDDVFTHHERVLFSKNEDEGNEAHGVYYPDVGSDQSVYYPDVGGDQNVETQKEHGNGRRHLVITRWQVPKAQKGGRNGFHASQNLRTSKVEPVHKHGPHRDPRAAPVNSNKVWTKKPKAENNGESVKNRVLKETINQADQSKCEVMIGSISVMVRNCTIQQQEDNCSIKHAKPEKNNVQEKLIKPDPVHAQCGTNRSIAKFWRPVSRQGTTRGGQVAVQSGNHESEDDEILGKEDDERVVPRESCVRSCGIDDNDSESGNNFNSPSEEIPKQGLLFCSCAAKDFLARRWKEAISGEHVKLVLTPEPVYPDDGQNEYQVGAGPAAASSDLQEHNILGNAENRLAMVETLESSTTGIAKPNKFRTKPDKGVKIKYIPRQRTVT